MSSSSSSSCAWHTLPTEMKLAVVDALEKDDLESFSRVDQRTYQVCIPAKYRTVTLPNFQAVERFLDRVPREYFAHIEELELSTVDVPSAPCKMQVRSRTEAVISVLAATPRLGKLSLRTEGSLDKSVVAPFPYLRNLRNLSIRNEGDDSLAPLSERLVVSIAASVPHLEELHLENISRSQCHAYDLDGNPDIPVVVDDHDIPDHPALGAELVLPSLLRLASLRKLTLRETHLGDDRWTTTPVACRLEVLDLGSYVRADEDFNTMCTERIMAAVGPSVDEFSLATAVSDHLFAKPTDTPLRRLRKLHISPFFPVDSVVDTVSNLAGSPIETLSLQCFEEDVVEVCSALEGFLSRKVARGPSFFDKLKRIDVTVAANQDMYSDSPSSMMGGASPCAVSEEEREERIAAAQRLQSICRDLRLASFVDKLARAGVEAGGKGAGMEGVTSFTDARRVKTRSMSI